MAIMVLLAASWFSAGRAADSLRSQPQPTPPVASVSTPSPSVPSADTVNALGNGDPIDNDPPRTVRLIGVLTDIGTKYSWMAPNIPIPPFRGFRQFMRDHKVSVHCALEWKDEKGKWFFAEMRSSRWDGGSTRNRVGFGQFPGTGYLAYGVFINPGRLPRVIDLLGRPLTVTIEEKLEVDYKKLEAEIRKYGAYGKRPGDAGTGNYGKENCGLGGPAYKPAQNSNTLVHYVLKKAGLNHTAPDMAAGWDTEPTFPYSSDTRFPKYYEQ